MAQTRKLAAACSAAVKSVNIAAPPDVVAESLVSLAKRRNLSSKETKQLIEFFFAHHRINPKGSGILAVLRSGYRVPINRRNISRMVEHLKSAIVGESIAAFKRSGSEDWDDVWQQMDEEAYHISTTMHEMGARLLLSQLLYESADTQIQELTKAAFPSAKNSSPKLIGKLSSCFISYSHKDEAFAESLFADLQARGVRCWFAPHHVQGGKKLYEQIREAIQLYDRLLLILSGHSMKSNWVQTEIANARQKEEQKQCRVLFPIRLVSHKKIRNWRCFDVDTGLDAAKIIREYFILDFSNWKDKGCYRQSLEKLLQDLRKSGTVVAHK